MKNKNTCIIGSERIFAQDLCEKIIKTLPDEDDIIFFGQNDIFNKFNLDKKENAYFYDVDVDFLTISRKHSETISNIIVTSDWVINNINAISSNRELITKQAFDSNHKVLVYYDIMDFEIDYLIGVLHYYDEAIFIDESEEQRLDVKRISNISFLLKSIKKAKADNILLEKTKKNLQMLNDSIVKLSFENDLEKIIGMALETAININKASYGSITVLHSNNKIEKEHNAFDMDMTFSYRIHSSGKLVGILTLGYRKEEFAGREDKYIIDIICNSLGDIIQTFKEKEEGKFLRNDSKTRFMGEVAGGIVHDLNNAFAIIKGYTQLLSINKNATNIKEYIDIIYNTTEEGIEKIKTIQDFSRNIKENKKYVYINDIIKKAVQTTRPKWENMSYIKGKNINVKLNLNSNRSIYVQESDMKESIINMILNSIDSMVNGGNLEINSRDEDLYVIVDIIDDGIGIADDIMSDIFSPFFTTKEKSTGLGLSIVKKTIDIHEGEISAEKTTDNNTKFTIRLPIREENKACYV